MPTSRTTSPLAPTASAPSNSSPHDLHEIAERLEDGAAGRRPSGITTEWISDLDAIAALEHEWRDLEERTSERMAFGSFDYLFPWYRHMAVAQGAPLVGVARRAGSVVGIAPLALRDATLGRVPVRRVESAGHDGDVGEILFAKDEATLFEALLESLFDRGGFHLLVLTGIAPGSWRHGAAASIASRGGRRLEEIPYRYATVDLSAGHEAYFNGLSAKLRANLRRRQKRAEGHGAVSFERIHRPVDRGTLSRYLDRIFQIYERSWKAEGGEALREYHRAFYSEVAERFNARGMLDLSILKVGARDASFILGLRERGTYYDVTISYDEAFASLSPGTLLIQEVARRIAPEGIRLLVSHGDREYKRYWTSRWVSQVKLVVFAPGVRPGLARFARFHMPKLGERLRSLLGRDARP